ncbi:MAG TPA: hypothetical protein PKB14_25455 [Rubrivivax sp.]|nr:hypothetical protein [Rubrivivax sp.]
MSRRYLTPLPCLSGALHQQPAADHLHCSAWAFTPDYAEAVDMRGAIDAPETIPSGSVRALDCERLCVGIAHVYRPGWRS